MEKLNFYQPFPQRCSDLEGKEKKLTGGVILDWLDLTLCISKGPTPYRTELPVLMQAFSWLSRISTENEELVEVSEKSAYVAYTHPPTTSHNKGRGRGRGRGSGVARGRGRSTARRKKGTVTIVKQVGIQKTNPGLNMETWLGKAANSSSTLDKQNTDSTDINAPQAAATFTQIMKISSIFLRWRLTRENLLDTLSQSQQQVYLLVIHP